MPLHHNEYKLIDSAEQAKRHPATWAHPPKSFLKLIQPGFIVKVGVELIECTSATPKIGGERFWTVVIRKKGKFFVVRVQQSDMLYSEIHGVDHDDILTVESRHIFGIFDQDMNPVWMSTRAPKDRNQNVGMVHRHCD